MSIFASVKEFIAPGSVSRTSIPPFEAALRANSKLDEAQLVLESAEHEPNSIVAIGGNSFRFSSGNSVFSYDGDVVTEQVRFDGSAGSLERIGADTVVAVEGRGLVLLDDAGNTTDLCTDDAVKSCITDLAAGPEGELYATVGSRHLNIKQWSRSLLEADRSGQLVRVGGTKVTTLLSGLAWPAGVLIDPSDPRRIVVSSSNDHRIYTGQVGAASLDPLTSELPFYPGRLRGADDGGYWVAAPYVRNRFTELMLTDAGFTREMMATIDPDEWLVPRLRSDRPHAAALQVGQIRVLGVLKPWAPARSYGLVAHIERGGRFDFSAHSRADGDVHGITDVAVSGPGQVLLAGQGCRNLVPVELDEGAQ